MFGILRGSEGSSYAMIEPFLFFLIWLEHDTVFPPFALANATKIPNMSALIKDTY